MGSTLPNPSIHVAPIYKGAKKKVCYVEGEGIIVVTFDVINDIVSLIKKSNIESRSFRRTNAHLIRLGLCTSSEIIPIFTGIEENAHFYFDKVIKPTLKPEEISNTGRHDGSDSSEEYAFRTILNILLTHQD